jgi:alkanesulfonate monooxygenase SsuD/methylene tetrahydromethanopterin reductase-like flavin-dependent oxidoreductase (luciferase family)
MPDYLHPLEFGTFLTPSNAPAVRPVEHALLCERLGYDLVTFQDHPYQPRFLDTWTLLSWAAARTERIRVAGNVLNLPLRQPAVLARAAVSLDLLSGGRFDLGIGAGGFWDAIEAMGGPRRSPGESVQALSEAIDIIRGIWDATERRPLRVDGIHYHVAGAKRGPVPSRTIPIVIGAYRPRMQWLVGAKADGWLPSLPALGPDGLATGNAVIDAAALDAGRDPRSIRRWLNISGALTAASTGRLQGPAAQWADELTAFAVQDGVSTFILQSDDEQMLHRFAAEVAPAVRAAVQNTRDSTGSRATTGPDRESPAGSR